MEFTVQAGRQAAEGKADEMARQAATRPFLVRQPGSPLSLPPSGVACYAMCIVTIHTPTAYYTHTIRMV